jgi:hypothetical protein
MAPSLESARARTFAERTARFWSVNRQGGPSAPPPRLMRGVIEGVADFESRRAITRSVETGGGGVVRRLAGAENRDVPPVYMLFDGTSVCGCLLGRWRDPEPGRPSDPLRGPPGLRFLDLIRPESIVEAIEDGEEEVRRQASARYRLKLDVDRIQWPERDPHAPSPHGNSLFGRLVSRALPDPTPKGILSAEVWIDSAGRLVRYSYSDVPVAHPKYAHAPWITTELWDFAIPPPLSGWKTQPVIDPLTLQFPQTEAAFIRLAGSKPDARDR